VGVYPRVRLLSWDGSRSGRGLTSGTVVEGLEAAASRGRGIVNLSLGGGYSRFEALAVAEAFARGVIVVAAAGNDGERDSPPSFPANLPHVATVAATDADDRVAAFSNRSRALDVAAPGVGIPIALPLSLAAAGYDVANGTSFSAPMVAGALAWAWTARPDLEKTQLLELLRRSARDLPPAGRDATTGFGLLDIPALLAAPAPPRDPFEPNDEVEQVTDAEAVPRTALTTQARRRSRVVARLDVSDDPRDVYPLWLPARYTATALVASGAPDLRLVGARPHGVTSRRTERRGADTLRIANSGNVGRYVYLSAFMPLDARPRHTTYTLTVTTVPARR
jgi:subtilisin family serine protease